MRWYDSDAGIWKDAEGAAYWWQSANMLTAFNDLALRDESAKNAYNWIWETTYNNAPASNPSPALRRRADGTWEKVYTKPSAEETERRRKMKRDDNGFINDFYDDEAWWALAWVGAVDNTGRSEYLDQAISIWYDMNAAWNKPSCGGLPWNKSEGSGPLAIQNGG